MLPPIRALTKTSGIETLIETPLGGRELDAVRILHVDDDPEFLELATTMLERQDEQFDVVAEPSAAAGLDRLGSERIDCVVCDYQMPDENGLQFLDQVRDRDPELPFILFTGKGSEEIASEAISRGVTDYLQKGGGSDRYTVLTNRIRNAVDGYRTYDDLLTALSWYRRLVEQDLAGIYVVQNETIVYVNQAFADVFGYSQNALVGRSALSIVAESDEALVEENLQRRDRGDIESVSYSWTGVREDGQSVSVRAHGGTVDFRGEVAILGILVKRNPDDE